MHLVYTAASTTADTNARLFSHAKPRTNTSSIASTGICTIARDNTSTRTDVGISSTGTTAGIVPMSIWIQESVSVSVPISIHVPVPLPVPVSVSVVVSMPKRVVKQSLVHFRNQC